MADRLPLAPVIERLERLGVDSTNASISRLTGIDSRRVKAWRARGVTCWDADRIATAFSLHPSAIWPEWESCVDAEVEAQVGPLDEWAEAEQLVLT